MTWITAQTTLDDAPKAQTLAQELVRRRLAACAQVEGPLTSHYWWQGKLETAQEWRITFKTHASLFADLEKAFQSLHPYDTPELIALPLSQVGKAYAHWLNQELNLDKP